ncbi:hypothetical protein N1851_006349 [Merluccius polli]|uniref:Uncharacterized protein n=1 Tax=Merluccius polli TaxID=89951 RepID=A0AA47P8L9_MERPO|nr:hypothetical protein N1851_006349 [Merluccius polli]
MYQLSVLLGDSGCPCKTAHKNTRNRFHVLHGEIRLSPERESIVITVCATLHLRCSFCEVVRHVSIRRRRHEIWKSVSAQIGITVIHPAGVLKYSDKVSRITLIQD